MEKGNFNHEYNGQNHFENFSGLKIRFRLKSFWERVTKSVQDENIDEILEQAVENVELSHLGWDEDDDELECWPRVYEQDERIEKSFLANNPFPPTIGFWRPF